jgi:Oxygen-sensitive ribonucleoside-triphosphate reductase
MSPTYSVCKEHGYLVGEQFVCPHCGQKTEVYSRITGYYRPIQNWNDGKTAEYHNRKEYEPENSHLTHTLKQENCEQEEKASNESLNEILLFATKTCPNCKMAKMLLEKAGVCFRTIYAEDDAELAKRFKIVKAPTLIVPGKDTYSVYENASNIKGFVEGLKN